ncbi:MAG: UDP-N-acetylglucosamine 2-epimerase (non-hydrolyzing) [Bacteroidia bacterium]
MKQKIELIVGVSDKKSQMKIISVVGARPNLMKIAAFAEAIKLHNDGGKMPKIHHILIHTGQHYDERMTDTFFRSLSIPEPDVNLQIGSGTHAEQVGNTMIAFEKVLMEEKPDWVVVPGDVNATLACSIAAAKLQIKVCHIEAGLRSNDNRMPEEINRIITDRISSLLLTPDRLATENLLEEGIEKEKIAFTGNIMIDTLMRHIDKAKSLNRNEVILQNEIVKKDLLPENFVLITLHRPSNVDDSEALERITFWIQNTLSANKTVIWVIHPRTASQLKKLLLWEKLSETKNLLLLHPLDYHHMLKLSSESDLIITDSGGLQEEATVLGKACIVIRPNTERPITLFKNGGSCILVKNDANSLDEAMEFFTSNPIKPSLPEKWDGKTAERCLNAIISFKKETAYA